MASALALAGTITGIGGKCVDVSGANTTSGTTVQLWDCNGNAAQSWTRQGSAFVGIGGKCLDAEAGSSANGTRVQLWDCNGTPAQQWVVSGNQLLGPGGKCLDAAGNSGVSGTRLILWDCWGGPNQSWNINEPVGAVAGPVMRAFDFTDSLGVNTHIDFTFVPVYVDRQHVIDGVRYLGLKHLRDDPGNPADVGAAGWWQAVAAATGARFDAFLAEGSEQSVQDDLGRAKQLAAQGILDFLEGGNEEDDPYAVDNGNTLAWTAGYQQTVFETGHALGLPVINMSFGQGWTAANDWHGDYDKVGDLSNVCDFGNAHTYPSSAPRSSIQLVDGDARIAATRRPVIATELGYDTHQTDPVSAAKWSLDAVFDGVKENVVKTYFYSLFDDGSGAFGLMNDDLTPKPSGAAIHNLVALLADTGASAATFTSSALAYTLSNNDETVLLQKSDGSYWLAIWNEQVGAHATTIVLGAAASQLQVFDPLGGADGGQSASSTASITVSVPDHPILLKIVR